MRHLLNNLSNEEKNRIREQHEGGMKVDSSKFKKLMESKLGNVKPLIVEQITNIEMVDGPFTFVRAENDKRQYYIYKQGKTDQLSKFYVYYQDNPTNPSDPDKLDLLGRSHATKDLASKYVQELIASEKKEQQGGLEY